MGDSVIHNLVSSCGSHSPDFLPSVSFSLPPSSAFWIDHQVAVATGPNRMHLDLGFDQPFWEQSSVFRLSVFRLTAFSKRGHDTPLSPSHAGDKGYFAHPVVVGLRPVDMVVLPRPSTMEEGKASMSVPSKHFFFAKRVE